MDVTFVGVIVHTLHDLKTTANLSDHAKALLDALHDHLDFNRCRKVPGAVSGLACLAHLCVKFGIWNDAPHHKRKVLLDLRQPIQHP